jgi:hypothetical protein
MTSSDVDGELSMGEKDEKTERLEAALAKIRFAGNNADATAIWMQKVAAYAMEPEKWPDPGPQSSGGTGA